MYMYIRCIKMSWIFYFNLEITMQASKQASSCESPVAVETGSLPAAVVFVLIDWFQFESQLALYVVQSIWYSIYIAKFVCTAGCNR